MRITPNVDRLIAKSARQIDASILTLDAHLQLVRGLVAVDRVV